MSYDKATLEETALILERMQAENDGDPENLEDPEAPGGLGGGERRAFGGCAHSSTIRPAIRS